jgi:hypothetical protein
MIEPMNLRAFLAVIGLAVCLLIQTAVAGALEDADAVFNRGDYTKALQRLRPLAEKGNAEAENIVGFMYENGYGVPKADNEAVKWYKLAVEQGIAQTQNNLGLMYLSGSGGPQNDAEAARWLRRAADPRDFTVQTVLDEVLRVIEPPARAKGLDAKIDGDGSVQAHADSRLLSRVVMNLASNAVEYTACGNIRISARHHSGSLKIDVADIGPGIPMDKRGIIFEKFQRLESTAGFTKPGVGLGLGLAISREFALLHGGRLEVTSETGKGSVFSLTIPIEYDEKPI